MKRPRLGAWMRLGIVLTGLWLVVGSTALWVWQYNINADGDRRRLAICEEFNQTVPQKSQTDCFARFESDLKSDSGEFPQQVMATGIAAVLAWLLFGIGYGLVRWILAGRKKESA